MGDTVILMTATVFPNGMGYTALQDPEVRASQYIEAIEFYLRETDLDIVFCENTGVNLLDRVASPEKHERLEYISFCGNDYDRRRGKSYGEGVIVSYALQHSTRLRGCSYVIKITGRVKIHNLSDMLRKAASQRRLSQYIVAEISSKDWIKSVCVLAPVDWMLDTVEKYGAMLHDIDYNFEKMLFRSVVETRNMRILRWLPQIEGVCGVNGAPYPSLPLVQRRLCHWDGLYHIYKMRGDLLGSMLARSGWLCSLVERKIGILFRRCTA